MTFNAGKYEAKAVNSEKTKWDVKSFDGKESFQLEGKCGTIANNLMRRTAMAFLEK